MVLGQKRSRNGTGDKVSVSWEETSDPEGPIQPGGYGLWSQTWDLIFTPTQCPVLQGRLLNFPETQFPHF